jgi:hypothetical protein
MYQPPSDPYPEHREPCETKEFFNDFLDSLIQNGEYPDPSGGFCFCFLW